jgi:hypothetical protein
MMKRKLSAKQAEDIMKNSPQKIKDFINITKSNWSWKTPIIKGKTVCLMLSCMKITAGLP